MGLEDKIRYVVNLFRDFMFRFSTKKLVEELKEVLKEFENKIPVIIVSYNNAIYVKNMVKQLNKYDIKPIIIDNNSTDQASLDILKELQNSAYVIYSQKNFGYLVGFINPVYKVLPRYFAYTDPDLELNKNLPKNFLDILKDVTKDFKVYKAGFALKLLDEEMIEAKLLKLNGYPKINKKILTVREWESRFWRFKLDHKSLEVYKAPLDTTFALYDKENLSDDFYDAVRVAGDFSCLHLPWYPKRELLSTSQKEAYLKSNNSSTWVTASKS